MSKGDPQAFLLPLENGLCLQCVLSFELEWRTCFGRLIWSGVARGRETSTVKVFTRLGGFNSPSAPTHPMPLRSCLSLFPPPLNGDLHGCLIRLLWGSNRKLVELCAWCWVCGQEMRWMLLNTHERKWSFSSPFILLPGNGMLKLKKILQTFLPHF